MRPLGVDLGRVDLAPEQRLDEAVFLREGHGRVHIGLDARKAFEIAVDEALRLGPRDAQVAGQAKAGNPVDDAEIDRLGAAAHLGRHFVQRDAEHLGRGQGVNVDPVAEGLLQLGDIRDMGQDAQLDLAVIEADQPHARPGDEGLADAAALFGAHGDVLKVRVGGGEPPGVRARDGIGGMHPPGLGVYMGLKRVGIGRFQLRELPPVQHRRRKFRRLWGDILKRRDVFQHIGAGRIGAGLALLAALDPHPVKENLAQLLGAADVERFASKVLNLRLKPCHLLREGVRHAA